MNGIINVLKPPGMTSFDVVGYLRKVLKMKRIGHTGTLDPGVAGVLPVCIGNATKVIEYIIDNDKLYRAEMTLGISTETQDSSGKIVDVRHVDKSNDQIREIINSFVGKYKQIPPMYSALKVGGRKLYELAREGITIEREPRDVNIFSIDVLKISEATYEYYDSTNISDDNNSIRTVKVLFDVACSKGTYIRTLCFDIGEKLGCGGHMSFLIRLKAGLFEISSALLLEEISDLAETNNLQEKMFKTDEVFKNLSKITIDGLNKKKFKDGIAIVIDNGYSKIDTNILAGNVADSGIYPEGIRVRVYDEHDNFIALAELFLDNEVLLLKSKKSFWGD